MLDPKLLRNDLDAVIERLKVRGYVFDREAYTALESRRKSLDVRTQELQAAHKQASKRIGELIKVGKTPEDAKAEVRGELSGLDEELHALESETRYVHAELEAFLLAVPNLPDLAVPMGEDEADNEEVARWGEPPALDFEPRDHVTLGEGLTGMDFQAASRVAGSRFVVLSGALAQLHRALTQFMLNTHTAQHGYEEVYVPYLVNREALYGTGQLPKFGEDLFRIADTDYHLIPTAEVPVTNLVRESILNKPGDAHSRELPLRFVCHTPCFRSEAGSYGKDTRGMIRQHQFDKVELVMMTAPEDSEAAHETLTGHAEAILRALELPYRKVVLCGGDLGFSASKTYDLEVWLPGQQAYREISSCSNFRDFQARRMQARWRNPDTGKPEYLHTLNGSGLAVGRALIAVLENYQQADGSVRVPAALQPYLGGLDTLEP